MTDADTPQEQPVQDSTPVEQPVNTDSDAKDAATFELDGQQVSLDELKAGYLRQADYTKKTQKVADSQRKYEELLARAKDQSLDTASTETVSTDSPQSTTDIPQDIIRKFIEREHRETVKDRMAEWDSFKAESGIKLTDEEEVGFMQTLAEREASGKPVNVYEAASKHFLMKVAEAQARKILAEQEDRSKNQTKTVGPGTGGKAGSTKSTFESLVELARQQGVE